ncbi:MAG: hypothetical protein R3320_02405, partial [Nitriliruptorales bacterium]|nr:hypothetical protein [Nitriliruptorales bacterium]
MIDPHLLRDDPETVTAALGRRGYSAEDVQELIALDERRRELIAAVDEARAEQKAASKEIGQAAPESRPALIDQAAKLKDHVTRLETELEVAERRFDEAFASVPNLPHPEAPDGQEGDGEVLRTVGEKPTFDFEVRDHVDLLEGRAIDLERAAKVSGARFAYLKGEGALLEFALVRYAMDIALEHGHVPVVPPVLVREDAMYG